MPFFKADKAAIYLGCEATVSELITDLGLKQ